MNVRTVCASPPPRRCRPLSGTATDSTSHMYSRLHSFDSRLSLPMSTPHRARLHRSEAAPAVEIKRTSEWTKTYLLLPAGAAPRRRCCRCCSLSLSSRTRPSLLRARICATYDASPPTAFRTESQGRPYAQRHVFFKCLDSSVVSSKPVSKKKKKNTYSSQ